MADFNGTSGLGDQIDALETAMEGAQGMTAAFTGELTRMQASIAELSTDVDQLSRGISSGLRKAFDGLIFDGMKLSDALRSVAQSMVDSAYNAALRPVANHFGGLLGGLVGGLMNGVTPFATGGVVSGATAFPMRGGLGLMGEAGPEAILPLARGPDGRLGVQAGTGGRPVNITMNITTPDVEGFRRSQAQIATQMARAIARGQRNL